MPRYALRLAYDGTDYAGWARVAGERTVASELDGAFARLGESGALVHGASRTDAGVHATAQVAHVDCARLWEPATLLRALEHQLPESCCVTAIAPVAADWSAISDVESKTYCYALSTQRVDPFHARRIWHAPWPIDIDALRQTATFVAGTRDWSAFVRHDEQRTDTQRTVTRCLWHVHDDTAVCTLSADGFLYHLVRSLVAGMVLVARGAATIEDWQAALAGTSNPTATQTVPAKGLTLSAIRYAHPPDWITAR